MATEVQSPSGHGFCTPSLLQSGRTISEDDVLAILRPLKNSGLPILATEAPPAQRSSRPISDDDVLAIIRSGVTRKSYGRYEGSVILQNQKGCVLVIGGGKWLLKSDARMDTH